MPHSSDPCYDPNVWGPQYWFVIHTIARTYPEHPTEAIKRKYYDFIQNLPIFIPDPKIGEKFEALLLSHPVSPYLDKRESFLRWVHYIHNKINLTLDKPSITFHESMGDYDREFLNKVCNKSNREETYRQFMYFFMIGIFLLISHLYVTNGE